MKIAGNRAWYYLRNRRLGGYKFVREYGTGNYIVDFVCREKKLIIEIDSDQHLDAMLYDSVPNRAPSSPTLLPQGRRDYDEPIE